MATAETARLFASLELQDKFTPGLKRADRAMTGFEKNTTRATRAVGQGFKNAGSSMGGFIKTGLGLAGVTLGIVGVTSAIRGVIDETTQMAEATRKFAAITGLSAEESSKWVDVLGDFNIEGEAAAKIFARLQVNADKFTKDQKTATKFQKEFGISLTDNKGRLVDANELLLRSAEFFNGNATAAQKAATLTKLYGKQWQDLIPLLRLNRAGIQEQFAEALTLTPAQLKDMAKLVELQRQWNAALGDLQVKIGVALIPTLNQALSGLIKFLDENEGQIIEFSKGAIRGVEELAAAVGSLMPIAKGIADAWNGIPADFRKLLLGGLVANKVLKMTIGFDPIDIARQGVTDAIGGVFKQFLGRGSPGNPVFTKEVGLGGVGGAGGVAAAGGKLGTALGVVGLIAAPLAVIAAQQEVTNQTNKQAKDVHEDSIRWLRGMPTAADLKTGLAAVDTGIRDIRSNPLNVLVQGEALNRLNAIRTDIVAAINAKEFAAIMSSPTYVNFRAGETAPRAVVTEQRDPKTGKVTRRTFTPDAAEVARRRERWRREHPGTTVIVNATTDHRQNSSAQKKQLRHGPTPATAGAD